MNEIIKKQIQFQLQIENPDLNRLFEMSGTLFRNKGPEKKEDSRSLSIK